MRELIFNLVNGVRSRIPLCCTLFFSYHVLTNPGPCAAVLHKERTGEEFDPLTPTEEDESHYVQCNYCYNRNKVKEIPNNGVVLRWLID